MPAPIKGLEGLIKQMCRPDTGEMYLVSFKVKADKQVHDLLITLVRDTAPDTK